MNSSPKSQVDNARFRGQRSQQGWLTPGAGQPTKAQIERARSLAAERGCSPGYVIAALRRLVVLGRRDIKQAELLALAKQFAVEAGDAVLSYWLAVDPDHAERHRAEREAWLREVGFA